MSALRSSATATLAAAALCCLAGSGCALLPDRVVEPQYHNPFPQLHRVAILPFYNQSAEPTVDGEAIAIAYYNELQTIPGFEVMPVGVAKQILIASRIDPRRGSDFQQLARLMGVDAVIVGSVTEYSPYYPPRVALAVDWYAANPGFHPIPPGYGLPWGRAEEEYIPSTLVREAEFALAREQLKTQTPDVPPEAADGAIAPATAQIGDTAPSEPLPAPSETNPAEKLPAMPLPPPDDAGAAPAPIVAPPGIMPLPVPKLPADWPDPRGFIPLPPSPERPMPRPQHDPLITHTRIYHGQDAKLTERLATYYYLRDDARFGGWNGYLQRPEDFVRFCCHLHVTETLAARGGAGEARVLWRWPISRYER